MAGQELRRPGAFDPLFCVLKNACSGDEKSAGLGSKLDLSDI